MRQHWRLWKGSMDVETILSQPETEQSIKATTFGGENLDHRISRVAWLTGNPVVHNLLHPYLADAKEVMGIDVGINSEIQYTEYHASEGGKYDWHHDVNWNGEVGADRKLSMTVQLSDPSEYEGGDFELLEVEQVPSFAKEKGTVLIFPSYLLHRVTPVTSGVRRSLVAWFTGPQWR